MSDLVLTTRNGAVTEVTLNRPAALNALSRALLARLTQVFTDLAADDDLRAIVLTGAGRAFCGGVDLKELELDPSALGGLAEAGPADLFTVIRTCPHPVIVAVNGFAVTGGLELALMGDFLLAGESARFADTHGRVGLTPSWGMTQILPRLIGLNRARQMSLTGDFIDARTACAWGLVNEVLADDALLPRARALAAQIAETDRVTMGRIRDLIAQSAETALADGLAAERAVFAHHIQGLSPEALTRNRDRVMARGRAISGDAA
jgi:enoyl-CoA hydratase